MDLRARCASRRRSRSDDLAAAAAGRGWSDVATVTLGVGYAATMVGLAVVHVAAAVADVVMIPEIPLMPVVPLVGASVLMLFWAHHLRHPCTVAALCFDVDGFKAINDDLGHATGDAVLVEVAERLRELVRDGDVVARLGGDEFALVLVDVAPAEADLVADRARLGLRGSAGVLDLP